MEDCFKKLAKVDPGSPQNYITIAEEYRKLTLKGDCGKLGAEICAALSKAAELASDELGPRVSKEVRFTALFSNTLLRLEQTACKESRPAFVRI